MPNNYGGKGPGTAPSTTKNFESLLFEVVHRSIAEHFVSGGPITNKPHWKTLNRRISCVPISKKRD